MIILDHVLDPSHSGCRIVCTTFLKTIIKIGTVIGIGIAIECETIIGIVIIIWHWPTISFVTAIQNWTTIWVLTATWFEATLDLDPSSGTAFNILSLVSLISLLSHNHHHDWSKHWYFDYTLGFWILNLHHFWNCIQSLNHYLTQKFHLNQNLHKNCNCHQSLFWQLNWNFHQIWKLHWILTCQQDWKCHQILNFPVIRNATFARIHNAIVLGHVIWIWTAIGFWIIIRFFYN